MEAFQKKFNSCKGSITQYYNQQGHLVFLLNRQDGGVIVSEEDVDSTNHDNLKYMVNLVSESKNGNLPQEKNDMLVAHLAELELTLEHVLIITPPKGQHTNAAHFMLQLKAFLKCTQKDPDSNKLVWDASKAEPSEKRRLYHWFKELRLNIRKGSTSQYRIQLVEHLNIDLTVNEHQPYRSTDQIITEVLQISRDNIGNPVRIDIIYCFM